MNNLSLLTRVLNSPMLMHGADHALVSSYLVGRLTQDFRQFEALANLKKYERRQFAHVSEGFGIIPVIGGLSHRDRLDADCMPITSYESIRSDYDKLMADPEVKAIIFEFDSGGGEARGCFDFCRHIFATRDAKPVLAYINESAYSAAYAIASACHQVFLPATAGAGSVGVIAGRMDVTKQYAAAGISVDLITAGAFKGDLHPLKPYSKEERARIQAEVNELATEFYTMVAAHRGLTPEAVKGQEAGTFTGQSAITAGLADKLMSQDQFYQYLKTTEIKDMFKGPLFGGSGETVTKAEHQKALADQQASLVKQAETAFAETLAAEKGKWQESEASRIQGIANAAKDLGNSDMALQLIVSGASLEDAKTKLFAAASNVENIFTSQGGNHVESPDGDNGNAMMAAVKAVAARHQAMKG